MIRRRLEQRDVKRKILFYHILVGGRTPRTEQQALLSTCIGRIDRLRQADRDDGGRYIGESDEDAVLTVFIDGPRDFRFGRIRRENLPLVADGDRLREIDVSDRGGLFECSHIVYFPPAIIGADFNFHGPRISRFADYLSGLLDVNNIEFIPVAKSDVIASLRQYHEIKGVSIKVSTGYASSHAPSGGLLKEVAQSAHEDNVEFIELILSSPRALSGGPLKNSLVREFFGLANRNDIGEGATKFKILGRKTEGSRIDAVDILRENLVTEEIIAKESRRGKTLDKNSAYAAVRDAYSRLHPERLPRIQQTRQNG